MNLRDWLLGKGSGEYTSGKSSELVQPWKLTTISCSVLPLITYQWNGGTDFFSIERKPDSSPGVNSVHMAHVSLISAYSSIDATVQLRGWRKGKTLHEVIKLNVCEHCLHSRARWHMPVTSATGGKIQGDPMLRDSLWAASRWGFVLQKSKVAYHMQVLTLTSRTTKMHSNIAKQKLLG